MGPLQALLYDGHPFGFPNARAPSAAAGHHLDDVKAQWKPSSTHDRLIIVLIRPAATSELADRVAQGLRACRRGAPAGLPALARRRTA